MAVSFQIHQSLVRTRAYALIRLCLPTGMVVFFALFLSGCGEVPSEEEPDLQAPIAEPGIRPTPRPDSGTGGEATTSGRVAIKVSPGRIQGVSQTVGLEGNVTTTFHSAKAVRVGLDITTSATTAKQTR
jgi:hypothetical protein